MNNNNNKITVGRDTSLMEVRKMQLENKFQRGITLGSLLYIMYSKLVFEEEIDTDVVNYNSFEEMLFQCGIEGSDDKYDFDALYLDDILDIYDHTFHIVHLAL